MALEGLTPAEAMALAYGAATISTLVPWLKEWVMDTLHEWELTEKTKLKYTLAKARESLKRYPIALRTVPRSHVSQRLQPHLSFTFT